MIAIVYEHGKATNIYSSVECIMSYLDNNQYKIVFKHTEERSDVAVELKEGYCIRAINKLNNETIEMINYIEQDVAWEKLDVPEPKVKITDDKVEYQIIDQSGALCVFASLATLKHSIETGNISPYVLYNKAVVTCVEKREVLTIAIRKNTEVTDRYTVDVLEQKIYP